MLQVTSPSGNSVQLDGAKVSEQHSSDYRLIIECGGLMPSLQIMKKDTLRGQKVVVYVLKKCFEDHHD
jgi:hypothetical protein